MRILILSFYYTPDLSAGAFRATALVRALLHELGPNDRVDVITTQPNRYESFRESPTSADESDGRLNVVRVALPHHRSGFLDQSRAFGVYAWYALKAVRGNQYDLVFATSSRLMTAFLGALVARWRGPCLYLDIRDIFVDTIKDVLPRALARLVKPIFALLERFTMRSAMRINLVSEGFKTYFMERYPAAHYRFVPNGIDEEFIGYDFTRTGNPNARVTVLYAGNIGEGQGLHRVVPGLARSTRATHEFWIVGDGGASTKLRAALSGIDNVKIFAPVKRAALLSLYRQCDVLFLHLNDYPAFRKVLPSKLFEYAATGKPVLAGVAGYAAEFLATVPNVAVFSPCDAQAGATALATLSLDGVPRMEFVHTYRRTNLMRQMAQDIVTATRDCRERRG